MLSPWLTVILLLVILLLLVWLLIKSRPGADDGHLTRLDTRFEEQHLRLEGISQRLTDLKTEQEIGRAHV